MRSVVGSRRPILNVCKVNVLKTGVASGAPVITKGILSSNFPAAWADGFTGRGVKIAVLDTGIDATHKDLLGKVVYRHDYVGKKQAYYSPHGTHVTGTLCANGWLIGCSYDSTVYDMTILDNSGGNIANLCKAIRDSADLGCGVISMSLGTSQASPDEITAINRAVAHAWDKGAICLAAAGNGGTAVGTADPYSFPAAADKVLSVGACSIGKDIHDIIPQRYSTENDRVSVAACGTDVLSTVPGNGYAIYSGTSMATPHASGMAALIYGRFMAGGAKFSMSDVAAEVIRNTLSLDPAGKDIIYGYGYVMYKEKVGRAERGRISPVWSIAASKSLSKKGVYLGHRR